MKVLDTLYGWKNCFVFSQKTYENIYFCKYKSRIQETKNLSTDADSSNNSLKTLLVRQNSMNKKLFLRCNLIPFMNKSFQIWDHFFPIVFHKDSKNLNSLDIGLWEVGVKRCLNRVNKWWGEIRKKNFFSVAAILHPLWAKVVKSETPSFHYFSLRIPKIKKKN